MNIPKEPVRQESIMAHLRERIILGTLPPGTRLPTRVALAEQFDTTVVTVQRALTRLSSDGFVIASGSRGTFVSKNPPHLFHYALVFATHPIDPFPWGHLWQGLVNEAMAINRTGLRKITCYYDVDGHSDSEDYQKLLRDVQHGRLAGLIFSAGPNPVISHPLFEQLAVPRIVFSSGDTVPTIWPDLPGFLDRAVEYLAQRGRRAPAVLLMSGRNSHDWQCDRLLAAIQKHGMRHQPHWFQFVDVHDREAPQRVVQAIMHRNQTEPPDSLIITDDTMLETATVGLAALGLRTPEIEVVAHSNFPWLGTAAVPVKRLGFDLRGMMQACFDSIDRQRQGHAEFGHFEVPAQFEHELQQTPAPLGAMRV